MHFTVFAPVNLVACVSMNLVVSVPILVACYLSSSTKYSPVLCLKSVAKYIASMPPSVLPSMPPSMTPSSGTARYAVLDRTRVPVLVLKYPYIL